MTFVESKNILGEDCVKRTPVTAFATKLHPKLENNSPYYVRLIIHLFHLTSPLCTMEPNRLPFLNGTTVLVSYVSLKQHLYRADGSPLHYTL